MAIVEFGPLAASVVAASSPDIPLGAAITLNITAFMALIPPVTKKWRFGFQVATAIAWIVSVVVFAMADNATNGPAIAALTVQAMFIGAYVVAPALTRTETVA